MFLIQETGLLSLQYISKGGIRSELHQREGNEGGVQGRERELVEGEGLKCSSLSLSPSLYGRQKEGRSLKFSSLTLCTNGGAAKAQWEGRLEDRAGHEGKKRRSDLVLLKGDVNVPPRGKEDRIKGKKVWEEKWLKEKDKRAAKVFAWPGAWARWNLNSRVYLGKVCVFFLCLFFIHLSSFIY